MISLTDGCPVGTLSSLGRGSAPGRLYARVSGFFCFCIFLLWDDGTKISLYIDSLLRITNTFRIRNGAHAYIGNRWPFVPLVQRRSQEVML